MGIFHTEFISHQVNKEWKSNNIQNTSHVPFQKFRNENIKDSFSWDQLIIEQKKDPNLIQFIKRALPLNEAGKIGEGFYLKDAILMRKWQLLDANIDEKWSFFNLIVVLNISAWYIGCSSWFSYVRTLRNL